MHHRPSPWAGAEQPPAAWSAGALWIWAFVATLPAPKRSDFLPTGCAGGIGLATRHLSPRSLQSPTAGPRPYQGHTREAEQIPARCGGGSKAADIWVSPTQGAPNKPNMSEDNRR